jgi:hypothetical protein
MYAVESALVSGRKYRCGVEEVAWLTTTGFPFSSTLLSLPVRPSNEAPDGETLPSLRALEQAPPQGT